MYIGVIRKSRSRFAFASSGETLQTSYWGSGEPNNEYGGREDCVETKSGKLNDAKCNLENGFICEKSYIADL